jgi:hypothetical protein
MLTWSGGGAALASLPHRDSRPLLYQLAGCHGDWSPKSPLISCLGGVCARFFFLVGVPGIFPAPEHDKAPRAAGGDWCA